MKKFKVYLDNCCFNRPYDDQTQLKVALETEAKLHIQGLVKSKSMDLVWSYILEYENSKNTNKEKMNAISKWRDLSCEFVKQNQEIKDNATKIMQTGIKAKDALHIACSIYSKCDCFITVDRRALNYETNEIIVCSPIEFLEVMEDD